MSFLIPLHPLRGMLLPTREKEKDPWGSKSNSNVTLNVNYSPLHSIASQLFIYFIIQQVRYKPLGKEGESQYV